MDYMLRNKASSHFANYLQTFLQTGETTGLPVERLTPIEWEKLNEDLKSVGVVMIQRQHRNGHWYYFFTKLNPTTTNAFDKTQAFQQGSENIINYLVREIKNKYPNIPENVIRNMIQTKGIDYETVYEQLRYKQDGLYTGTSQQDLEDAFVWALQSSGNRNELISMPVVHNWNPNIYRDTSVLYMRYENLWGITDRKIRMSGTQNWTWFRSCVGNVLPPAHDLQHPDGYHISLNVQVNRKVLEILDKFLLEDGGRYIHSYKFPKTNFYEDVTRRHDPITIYMNARNIELEQKIVKALQPFVRSNDGLVGEMLGRGVSISPETSSSGVSVGKQVAIDISKFISQYKDRL